jgi:Ca2+-binding EF-hand superfamily protein
MSSEKLETRLESFRSAVLESFSTSSCEYISYDTFRALLVESDLTDLANKRVFNIFDLNKTGMIDMKDFLLTMAALNFGKSSSRRLSLNSASSEQSTHCGVEGFGLGTPGNSPTGGDLNDSNHSLAHLYFSIFDISGRGYIELDQMKTAIDYILCQDHAELGPRRTDLISPRRSHDEVFDVEMLFAMIDTDGDGKIDFEKFSSFFNKLRASTI